MFVMFFFSPTHSFTFIIFVYILGLIYYSFSKVVSKMVQDKTIHPFINIDCDFNASAICGWMSRHNVFSGWEGQN